MHPLNRLALVRSTFFSDGNPLGEKEFRLHRQSVLCILAALALGALGLTFALAPGHANAVPERPDGGLSLGEPGLKETRTTERVAPGVVYTKIERGRQTRQDFYTVNVAFTARRAAAESVAERLRSDGSSP